MNNKQNWIRFAVLSTDNFLEFSELGIKNKIFSSVKEAKEAYDAYDQFIEEEENIATGN